MSKGTFRRQGPHDGAFSNIKNGPRPDDADPRLSLVASSGGDMGSFSWAEQAAGTS
jgi:hypothetical protein